MSDLDELKHDVKNKSSELYNELKNKAEATAKQVTGGVSDLYSEGKEHLHHLEHCIGKSSEEFIGTIKKNPISAVLIAGGIGFLLSHLLKK